MEGLGVILLILLGVGLLAAEIIFVAGTTIVGILGVLLNIVGIYLSYDLFGSFVGHISLGTSLVVNALTLYYGFTAKTWDRFALKNRMDTKILEEKISHLSIGELGMTLSVLKPIGNAEFKNQIYEVFSNTGQFIEKGELVAIVKIEGKKIFVQKLHD